VLPRSHKDTARKAFERVTKSVLPASHKALQRALEVEAKSYRKSVDEDIQEPVDGGAIDEDLDVDELDD